MKILKRCSALIIALALVFAMQLNVKAITISDDWQYESETSGISEYFYDVAEAEDGGYVSAGAERGSFETPLIVKTSADGTQEWSKTYPVTADSNLNDIIATSDGGFIACGYDGVVLKIDQDGNQEWFLNQADTGWQSIQQTSDGGYIVAGVSEVDYEGVLTKYQADGTVEWTQIYGNASSYSTLNSVVETADGEYVAVGIINETASIMKTDAMGNQVWLNNLSSDTEFEEIQKTSDGNFILVGSVDNSGSIVKIDENGDELWSQNYAEGEDCFLVSITETNDGGFLAVGMTSTDFELTTPLSENAGWVIKIDADGNLQKSQIYHQTAYDKSLESVIKTKDGDYVAAGIVFPDADGSEEGWIIKLDITYKVSFDANGGQGTMAAQNVGYQDSAALTGNTFTKAGYTFKGWAVSQTDADQGIVTYNDKANYQQQVGKDVVLYAVWAENSTTPDTNTSDNDATNQIDNTQTLPKTGNEMLMYAGAFMILALGLGISILRKNN